MIEVLLLDTGPLGMLMHPKANADIEVWFREARKKGRSDTAAPYILIPEIADYELRRKLLHKDFHVSLKRLDVIKEELGYLPLNTSMMMQAAAYWADARKRHQPNAPPDALDGDVILIAQAKSIADRGMEPIVVTDNADDFEHYVAVKRWAEITSGVRPWATVDALLRSSEGRP